MDKLPKAERDANAAKDIYAKLNMQLIEEIPKLIDLRVPYLDPCFEALIKCQLNFGQAASAKMSGLRSQVPQHNVEGQVESVLQQLKDMAIAGQISTTHG
jgi:amphiphysin